MVATPSGGEFNRLDRGGDNMEGGNLQLIDAAAGAQYASLIEFLDTVVGLGGTRFAAIRVNGNDLEFYDTTVGAWVKLSQLTGHLGDVHYVVPTPGQFVFNLPFSYVVGSNTLDVMLISTGKIPGPGAPTPVYAETSPTVVTFLNGPAGIAPWTPFLGTELLCFYVGGRPTVNDTYLVKVDVADIPDYLENQVEDAGAAQAATVAKVGGKMQTSVPLTSTTPVASSGAGAVGTEVTPARGDHVHPAPTAILGSSTPLVESGAGIAGVAVVASREDHVHPLGPVTPLGSATPLVESGAGSAGVSGNASREDHVHPAASASSFLGQIAGHTKQVGTVGTVVLVNNWAIPVGTQFLRITSKSGGENPAHLEQAGAWIVTMPGLTVTGFRCGSASTSGNVDQAVNGGAALNQRLSGVATDQDYVYISAISPTNITVSVVLNWAVIHGAGVLIEAHR